MGLGKGDYEAAVAQLSTATQMEPDSAEAYRVLGQLRARQALEIEPEEL